MSYIIPDNLLDLTRELILLRKKPGTEERYRAYPALMQRFNEQLELCDDPVLLKQVLALDSGYFLLAGYRQRVIEKLLAFGRSAALVRAYALQLELFGDVDEYGQANTNIDDRINALHAEADALEASGT